MIVRSILFTMAVFSLQKVLGAEKNNLLDTRTYSESDAFVIEMKFEKSAPSAGISTDFINETIQINIPNGFLNEGTRTAKINSGQVSTLFTYQADKDVLRSRIILRKGLLADRFRGAVFVEPEGKYLRIRIGEQESKTAAQVLDANQVIPQSLRSEIVQDLGIQEPQESAPVAKNIVVAPTVATNMAGSAPTLGSVNEESLPVLSKGKSKSMKSESPIKGVVIAVTAILFFAFLIFFVSRQWSKVGRKNLKANQIKVITQHYLAPRKSLAIIRVAGESILIGITDNSITPIKTLALLDDEVPEIAQETFQKSMRQVEEAPPRYTLPQASEDKVSLNAGRSVKAYANNNPRRQQVEVEDEYSIQGIRDLVKEKLKDMRTI